MKSRNAICILSYLLLALLWVFSVSSAKAGELGLNAVERVVREKTQKAGSLDRISSEIGPGLISLGGGAYSEPLQSEENRASLYRIGRSDGVQLISVSPPGAFESAHYGLIPIEGVVGV